MAKVGKSPRGRYAIPQVPVPPGRICYCMTWPDDPEHFAVLWGFFESLTHRYTWGEPLTADSELLATLYAQIYDENREHFEGLF